MVIYFIEAERSKDLPPTQEWFDAKDHKFFCPSLGLLTLASLTPPGIKVKVIDEKIEELSFDDLPDVAAISFKTMSSVRAYSLADRLRERGVKVILGGIHASLMPEEAKFHADSVITGEGEEAWVKVVQDLVAGSLQPFYRMERLTNLDNLPIPHFELLKHEKYFCHAVQSSRGCILECDFCPTREMFGGVFRTKPVKKVIAEIQAALSFEKKCFFFTDDIFGAGNKAYTLELLKEIKKLNIEFFVFSDFLVLNKRIVVELARSGCRYMGLNMPGSCSREELEAVKMIQLLGMHVWGYFMFGFRFHEADVFGKVHEFINKTKMKHASFTVMAPYPNTNAGRKLSQEGRILSKDWELYDQAHVIFKPEKMGIDDLEEGFRWIKERCGHLSRFSSDERSSLWKIFRGRCLAEISAILPSKSRKS